jgi:hypothetical protein
MSGAMDRELRDALRLGLEAELDSLPDPNIIWWRAYHAEKGALMARAALPVNVLAALAEAATCFAPAILLSIATSRGYFSTYLGSFGAFVLALLFGGSWVAARFHRRSPTGC